MEIIPTRRSITATACTFVCVMLFNTVFGQHDSWTGAVPSTGMQWKQIADRFSEYSVVLEPDQDAAEYWAGAPSVVRDPNGTFWMAARMRSPEHPRGLRGYEIRILKSSDGQHFERVHSIHRESVPIPGFERPSLIIDPATGMFKLYACGPWGKGPWCIIKFADAESPELIDPTTAHPVIEAPAKSYARDISVLEYKDPFIIYAEGLYHCYVTGYIRRNEWLFHFTSTDGEQWTSVGNVNQPIMDLSGWHNFFIRPASVLPVGVGYLFVYEGSSSQWYDPVYNVVTGLGFTFDLHHIQDLTPDAPLVTSTTPSLFYTWRYSHWMWVGKEIYVYAEVAKKNYAHEIRLFRLHLDD